MRAAAESNLKKLVLIVGVAVAVIGVASFYPQFAQGYDIKTAAKLTCNDVIKLHRYPGSVLTDPKLDFIKKAKRAGVKLEPDQFSFEVEDDREHDATLCHVRVAYPVVVEWAFIGDVLKELKPYTMKKVIKVTHKVARSY